MIEWTPSEVGELVRIVTRWWEKNQQLLQLEVHRRDKVRRARGSCEDRGGNGLRRKGERRGRRDWCEVRGSDLGIQSFGAFRSVV